MNTQNINQQTDIEQQIKTCIPTPNKFKFLHSIIHKYETIQIQGESNNKNKEKYICKSNIKIPTKPSVQFQEKQWIQKKIVCIKGNKINGTWKNNLLHGEVSIEYKSGEYFEGKYVNGSRVQGKLRFIDGMEYVGGFKNDLFHGKGTLTDLNNRVIACQWDEGKHSEKVTIEYPSGDIYYGQVRKMKKHGEGHLFFKNGKKYIGKFRDGAITGQGCLYDKDSKIAEGIWINGILEITSNIKQILMETIKTIQKLTLVETEAQVQSVKDIATPLVSNRRTGMRQNININTKIKLA